MATEETLDLAAALAAARQPLEPCRRPAAPLGTRVRTDPRLRRLLPTRTMVLRAERRAQAAWQRCPSERARSRAAIEAIVGATPHAERVEALARRHLVEERVREALFWQPWAPPALEEGAAVHLRAALGAGRGVLISFCHMGPYLQAQAALASSEHVLYSAAGVWLLEPPSANYWGRRIARWRAGFHDRNQRPIRAAGSFAVFQALLAEGERLLVQFDVPGSWQTRLLGKNVMLASGSARLAAGAGALVLPMRARRAGHRVWADFAAPLDPHDFGEARELHDALARLHERWILELPATLEDPRREGAWEQGATAEAWVNAPSRAPADG